MIELFPEEKRAIEYRYEHSLRVASIALDIAKKEGLDEDRCYIGALLHDLGYSVPYDNPKEYVNHGRIGAKLARPFLESLGYSEEEVNEICYGIAIHVDDKADFEDVFAEVKKLLENHAVKVLVMNGKHNVDSLEYSEGSNIVIGGNTLGRGVTFPALHTIYYTRTSKRPQADTMWQHSRMFGYDRDPGMMKVYIDEQLYKLFSDINATNNSIIAQIEKGVEDIKIYYPDGLNPTRGAVLDNKKVFALSGGTNYFPFNPDNNTVEKLDMLLATFDEQEQYYQVSLRLMKEIFGCITSDNDFNIPGFISVLDALLAEKPSAQGIMIVRRDRDVAKGTGALLSPNDWRLGSSFTDCVVLTMYKVTGRKGWGGKKLWVPNIKLPNNVVYYDVKDSEEESIK